jgi:diguanylate cyclase (GGDEF)-like protein/PAS domain S-box-containing protein
MLLPDMDRGLRQGKRTPRRRAGNKLGGRAIRCRPINAFSKRNRQSGAMGGAAPQPRTDHDRTEPHLTAVGEAEARPDSVDQRRGGRRGRSAAPVQPKPSPKAAGARARARTVDPALGRRTLISPNWAYMSSVVFASSALAWLIGLNAPAPAVFALLAAGALVPLASRWVRKLEKSSSSLAVRVALMLVVVALPMFLVGLGNSLWSEADTLDWRLGFAALIATTSLAAVIQSGRPIGLFAGQIACWSAVILIKGSWGAAALLAACILFAAVAVRRQAGLANARAAAARERERVRNRAEDILTDYEEAGQGWFWETDRRGMLTYVSHTVAAMLGHARPDRLAGRPFIDLFNLNASGQEGERTLTFHLSARSQFQDLTVRAAIEEERWWSISGRPVYDDFDNFVGFRGSGIDLTEKKRSQERAKRLAHYDSLTGLANRFQMSQLLERILKAPIELQRYCAVLLLDLDRFKQVNDTMGHPAGDALLKQVAERLKRAAGDMGQVGRLGGDEFEVIVPGRIDRARLAQLAQEIINALSQPYSIDGMRVVIGASLGISIAPDDGVTSEAMVRNADLALYAAKDRGRGRYHFYADDLHEQAEERRALEHDLRDAIARGGLELAYQPVVDTASERISGFEALMRWNHPVKGPLSPGKFIEIAEDAGLIGAMGEWALRTACHDLAKWPEEVRVAVNVSPLQFANPQLPSIVTSALAQVGVDPSRLELEITESVFLSDDEGTDAMFAALKRIGVRLALDDFGTGYSSLGYLKKAPFDKIKIDQSFVRGATQPGSRNGALIASITSLAGALGMETTAEGVETLDELDLVRLHGCSHVQGYIYERPLSAEAAAERLESGMAAVARGPRSSRSPRQTMLRKVVVDHDGQQYHGTIRNISSTGALIEGLWNVPAGTVFRIEISGEQTLTATARWCEQDRMGIEFAAPLQRNNSGRIAAEPSQGHEPPRTLLREAG